VSSRVGGTAWLSLLLCGARSLAAQGVTGAAVQGTVIASDNAAMQDATVLVTNTATGERWRTATGANGRFFVEHLSVGGPYRIEVREIGFGPTLLEGLYLSLGERHTLHFSLRRVTVELAELTVRAAVDPLINPGRTGPSQVLSDTTILRLPSPRDYTELALLSPQVNAGTSAISFAGQPDRQNGLQVDGTTNNDLFNTTETGNGTIAGFPDLTIPRVESIQAIQIATAPFDVRYGGFAGGLVNAVTKSGTNVLHGAAYGFFEDAGLTGRDATGSRAPDFGQREAGLSLGGPILRDRLAFFVDAGLRRRSTPQPVRAPGADTASGADSAGIGIRYASAVRMRDILRDGYGVDPGGFEARADQLPSGSLLAKLTAQLAVNSRLELSHDYFHADQGIEGFHDYGFIGFSSNRFHIPLSVHATRLNWTSALGRGMTNELLLARVHEGNSCVSEVEFPSVDVLADAGRLVAGSFGCDGLETRETIWELTDNLGIEWGSHRFTVGMHHEVLQLLNRFRAPGAGHWFFDNLDSLAAGRASRYERSLPGPLAPGGPVADFPVQQIGFYLQDQWAPTTRLTLTVGVRLDVPFLPDEPARNPDLLAGLSINTAATPSGHTLWSPRIGVSYDVSGAGSTFLRGGIGLFAGRPAYIWFREAHFNTGLQRLRLTCSGEGTPGFTPDPARQPTQCAGVVEPVTDIAYFDPNFPVPPEPQGRAGLRSAPASWRGGNGRRPVREGGGSVCGDGREPAPAGRVRGRRSGPGHVRNDRSGDRRVESTAPQCRLRTGDRDVQPLRRPHLVTRLPAPEAARPGHGVGRRIHLYRRPGSAEHAGRSVVRQPGRERARRDVGAPQPPPFDIQPAAQGHAHRDLRPAVHVPAGTHLQRLLRRSAHVHRDGRCQCRRHRQSQGSRSGQRPCLRAQGCGRHHPDGFWRLHHAGADHPTGVLPPASAWPAAPAQQLPAALDQLPQCQAHQGAAHRAEAVPGAFG
jgi:hypothetical protein